MEQDLLTNTNQHRTLIHAALETLEDSGAIRGLEEIESLYTSYGYIEVPTLEVKLASGKKAIIKIV